MNIFILLYQTKYGQLLTCEIEAESPEAAAEEPPDSEGGVALGAIEIHPADLSAHERGDFARTKLHIF